MSRCAKACRTTEFVEGGGVDNSEREWCSREIVSKVEDGNQWRRGEVGMEHACVWGKGSAKQEHGKKVKERGKRYFNSWWETFFTRETVLHLL